MRKIEGLVLPPPELTPGQMHTARLFKNLGLRFGHFVPQLHDDESRTERSVTLLNEAELAIRAAIVSGRQPESRMPSTQEMDFFKLGLERRLGGLFNPELIYEMAETEIRPIFEAVGLAVLVPPQRIDMKAPPGRRGAA